MGIWIVARNEADEESDINILVDIDPSNNMGLMEFMTINGYLNELLDSHVDLVKRKNLDNMIRRYAEKDAIHAF